jgi:K+-sensing histidine kinase KdpD
MVWHVRRRQSAFASLALLAGRERERARDREWLTRLTSHEMRTPLTIARGYVELVLDKDIDPERRADLAVVLDELGTLTRVCERLVRVIGLPASPALEPVDLDDILRQTAERWAPVANRRWVVQADAGAYHGSAESLRTSLDTLIENALRYTADGDTVRLVGTRHADFLELGVADSGAGMSQQQLDLVNQPDGRDRNATNVPRDELSQTGLGLGLVRTVVGDRGGQIRAGRAPEGGAFVVMRLPLDMAAQQAGVPTHLAYA